MIHVFECAKETCSLPGKACVECGKLAQSVNCEPCVNCCTALGQSFSNFMDKPLSTYVVIKILLSSCMFYYSYAGYSTPASKKCDVSGAPVSVVMWLTVQMIFAAIHLVFAPYFQFRVWSKISTKMQEQPALAEGEALPSSVIYESFKEVFLHDLGILFYFVVLVGSFIWSCCYGSWYAGGVHAYCDPQGNASTSSYWGLSFFWVAVTYNFCYYYCGCCAGSVKLRDPSKELLGYMTPGSGSVPGMQQMMNR
mmetsp:Transcript_53359/g.95773  ORF Transcript_53359/g.95773 Transcript_53359/m.95773 type:complete len:252 (-) Transcript_53359:116-871(-)|eukprot:CAMPEP_0197653144 /NCGR_PEP_ID=MMETSP1338-20131121/34879_1 /TAXON_ID=43686 ORGANISM="Pelagodinium beii, Strain RCC1491" /NCGR_SAMPLE_ID=MMETSP1338 /ASSEMBLY_ACC=CAM_ASM_000754 /LENGTH=251 /DNA_ID=CAMNT_0043228167 /DNA_START=38 /DNA_END=793 /DNA_ORIENTATION=-